MFAKIWSFLPGSNIIINNDESQPEIEPNDQSTHPSPPTITSDKENIIPNREATRELFTRTGIVGSLTESYGYIDNIYFDPKTAATKVNNLEKGMKVVYSAYRLSDDIPIKIVEIERIVNGILETECVDELDAITSDYFKTQEYTLITKIFSKRKNTIEVSHDMIFDLDKVSSDFVPQINDHILLKYIKHQNTNDFEIQEHQYEVLSLHPTKLIKGNGRIRNVNGETGVINRKYFYHLQNLQCNFKPELNDKVKFEAIESDNENYLYRCIHLEMAKPKTNGSIRLQTPASAVDKSEEMSAPIESPTYRNYDYLMDVFNTEFCDIVPGERTVKRPNFIFQRIGVHGVPKQLMDALVAQKSTKGVSRAIDRELPYLNDPIDWNNYQDYFHALLYLEEIQFFHNMRTYDLKSGHFQKEDEYLSLVIENLSERRPCLAIGDSVLIQSTVVENGDEGTPNKTYEGYIHKVLQNKISLKFNPSFQSTYSGEDYKIIFQFSRMKLRKMHHAINKSTEILDQHFFLPTRIAIRDTLQLDMALDDNGNLKRESFSRQYKWFNEKLNPLQKEAVKNILRGETRPMPYIIFGPPGTGKTVTLIETILQLTSCLPSARILVATPSNNSANLITEHLMYSGVFNADEMIRIVSFNLVEKELISDNIAPFCATVDIALERTAECQTVCTNSGIRLKYTELNLEKHRVTIGTCVTLGTFFQMKFAQNHFTHIIIDEAAQCLEPEILIPIAFVDKNVGQIILAGDPMQLNPIVLSPHAAMRNFSKSFLARMLEQYPYKKDLDRFESGYDSRLITKLKFNYRSLPSILSIYSDLFYDSELIPMVTNDSKEMKMLKQLGDILPNAESRNMECGFFFYGVVGECDQYYDSPSWFNQNEAKLIYQFIIKLYSKNINPASIGVISPYQKQVRHIRKMMEDNKLLVPKIGSIEEFQGQEKEIILISTVRSDPRNLGFVREPKRLNVAISRATTLLVIFGNPLSLADDYNWNRLINIAKENNTYVNA